MTLLEGSPAPPEGPKEPPGEQRRRQLQVNVVTPKVSLRKRALAIWRYRELLVGMTRKELRVQYKDSVLGFLWSMLNPATTLLVYYFVFQVVLHNGIPRFAIFLISGTLVWTFFQNALSAACGSVVGNGSIIKKVAFPREIPALSVVGSNLVQMGFQAIVMAIFLVAFRRGPAIEYVPLIVPALLALVVLATALGILFAAINVRMRDMSHLLGVALQVWFWACPIVYQYRLVADRVAASHSQAVHVLFVLYRLNPITPLVLTFQRAIYASTSPYSSASKGVIHILPDHAGPWWYLWQDLAVLGFALAMLAFAMKVFGRAEGSFAEEI